MYMFGSGLGPGSPSKLAAKLFERGRLCSLVIPGVRNHFRALRDLSEDWLSWFLGQ